MTWCCSRQQCRSLNRCLFSFSGVFSALPRFLNLLMLWTCLLHACSHLAAPGLEPRLFFAGQLLDDLSAARGSSGATSSRPTSAGNRLTATHSAQAALDSFNVIHNLSNAGDSSRGPSSSAGAAPNSLRADGSRTMISPLDGLGLSSSHRVTASCYA